MARLPQKEKSSSYQQELFEPENFHLGKKAKPSFFESISKYLLDLVGVILIALACIQMLAILGITRGVIITPITVFLDRWFGIGKYFFLASLFFIGIVLIRWHIQEERQINLRRILLIEVAIFSVMGLFSIFSRGDIISAESGQNPGGIIGWGISEFFSIFVGRIGSGIILSILFLLSVLSAFGILVKIKKWVRAQSGSTISEMEEMPVDVKITTTVDAAPEVIRTESVELDRTPAIVAQKPRSQQIRETRKTFDFPGPEKQQNSKIFERVASLPPLSLLEEEKSTTPDKHTINMTAGLIEKTLLDFGIPSRVVGYRVGPTVIQYAVEPGFIEKSSSDDKMKIRISQISSLSKDLALALKAERLRIEAPVPGKSYVGIEIPNTKSTIVKLRPMLESEQFQRVNSPLAIPLGKDVSGQPLIADLASMPHLLIAGTTGSGKSVCIAAITTCLVMNNSSESLKLVMIDPKMVELMRFNGLPHILGKVETEVERIQAVLRWVTAEMDYRYKLLEKVRARDIDVYNMKIARTDQPKLPKVVVVIDELADLMMTAPEQTEHALVRLAQKSRAVGIHLVVATQRPSTDIVTGKIKANFPTRIAFTVASNIDSRVILDVSGAETLLGKGDMLYLHPEIGTPIRSQGVMITDRELDKVLKWWQANPAEDKAGIGSQFAPWENSVEAKNENGDDDGLIDKAIEVLKKDGRASASYLQRALRIGYPRAARLIDQLEERGVIGPSQGGGKERDIFLDNEQDDE